MSRSSSRDLQRLFSEREHVSCNLCGTGKSALICEGDEHGFNLSTVVCETCGLLYLSPRPSAAAYQSFYEGHYHALYPSRASFSKGSLGNRISIAGHQERCEAYSAFLEGEVRFLEIGAGNGGFLQIAQEHWPTGRFSGLDLAPEEVAVCELRGIDVRLGNVEDSPSGRFTHVAAFHTLEHALDPSSMLRAARKCLQPKGLLFIEVPDIESEWRGLGMIHVAHPYMFSSATLGAMMKSAGFEMVKLEAVTSPFLAGSLRAIGRCTKTFGQPAFSPPAVEEVRRSFARRVGNRHKHLVRRWIRNSLVRALTPALTMRLWELTSGRRWATHLTRSAELRNSGAAAR